MHAYTHVYMYEVGREGKQEREEIRGEKEEKERKGGRGRARRRGILPTIAQKISDLPFEMKM